MIKTIVLLFLLCLSGSAQTIFTVGDDIYLNSGEVILVFDDAGQCQTQYQTTVNLSPNLNYWAELWRTNSCNPPAVINEGALPFSGDRRTMTIQPMSVYATLPPLPPGWSQQVFPNICAFANASQSLGPFTPLPSNVIYTGQHYYVDWAQGGVFRVTNGSAPNDFNKYLSDGHHNPNWKK